MTVMHFAGSCRSARVSVLVAIFLCVLSPQVFAASYGVIQDSTDADPLQGSTESPSPSATSEAGSIEDLFRDYSDDLSRLSATYDFIGTADEAKLIDFFDQVIKRKYTKQDRAWKSELISLISSRLAPINLNKAISLYDALPLDDAKYMLYGITYAWASTDLSGAKKFARQQDLSVQPIALRGIVDANLDLPEKTLLELGAELGDIQFVKRTIATIQLHRDLLDPDQAWANMVNDPTMQRQENFDRIKEVANLMIDKHGAAEFDDLVNSVSNPSLSYELRKSVLSRLTISDPDAAFTFALETPNDLFGIMQKTVIDTWARTDPQSALSRIRLLEHSKVRVQLEERVITTWLQQEPENFVSLIASIPFEIRDTARISTIEHFSTDSIGKALAILPEISDAALKETAAQTILKSWIHTDHEAAFQWIVSSSEVEESRNRLLSSFMQDMSAEDADTAFELALTHPVHDGELGLEFVVIESIRFTETDHALNLLPRVRPGRTKLAAFEAVSEALLNDKGIDEAFELGRSLTIEEQKSFYSNLATPIVTQESSSKILEILPQIPVKEAQSKLAERALVIRNISQDDNSFSEEQVETLMEYVEPSSQPRVRLLLKR